MIMKCGAMTIIIGNLLFTERKNNMIKLIKNWYKTKKIQAQLKAEFYGIIRAVIQEKENIKELIENAYDVLKDTPKEELQQKIIEQVAVLVHETNQKNRNMIDD